MKRNLFVIAGVPLLLAILLAAAGCQNVFTFSPFSFLQRDPASLSNDQKEQYAADALAGGDATEMAEALELIEAMLADDPENGELNLLAADLAIGASGMGDLLSNLDPEAGFEDPDALLSEVDTAQLDGMGDFIDNAEAASEAGTGPAPTESQYTNAAAAIIAKKADDAGGFDNLDWENDSEILQAKEYADKGGIDIEALLGGGGTS